MGLAEHRRKDALYQRRRRKLLYKHGFCQGCKTRLAGPKLFSWRCGKCQETFNERARRRYRERKLSNQAGNPLPDRV